MKMQDESPAFFQQDLFASPYIKYNRAKNLLLQFNFLKAEKLLKEFEGCGRGEKDLGLEYRIVDFLKEAEPLFKSAQNIMILMGMWEEKLEQVYRKGQNESEFLSRFRKSFFRRLASLLSSGKGSAPWTDAIFRQGPGLLIMIRGGFYREAASIASRAAEISGQPGKIYGYQADALYLMDKVEDARRAYLTALLLDPSSVDTENLCDPQVRELLENPGLYLDEQDIPEGPWNNDRQWAAVTGLLAGIFRLPSVVDAVQAAEWKDTLFRQDSRPGAAFAAGMILSSQGMKRLELIHIDISSVRRKMRKISPELFAAFMNKAKGLVG